MDRKGGFADRPANVLFEFRRRGDAPPVSLVDLKHRGSGEWSCQLAKPVQLDSLAVVG